MDFIPPRRTVRTGPEAKGLQRLCLYLRARGWYIKKLHGGKYQSGLPDLLALHSVHGLRWIEMKAPNGKLRVSQINEFCKMEKHGQQIHVLEDESHYERLFKPGNWRSYQRW